MSSSLGVVENVKAAMELKGRQIGLNWRQVSIDLSTELVSPFDLAVCEVMINCSLGIHTVNNESVFETGAGYHRFKTVPSDLLKVVLPSI